jgi:hypothetical protein
MGNRRQPHILTGKARLMDRLRAKAQAATAPPIEELTIACVGASHANPKRKGQPTGSREMEIMFTERGQPVELRPEPGNKADASAIAVFAKTGIQLGYVSADRTLLIHRAWHDARDVHAVFQQRTPWGAWIRVGFDRAPAIPPESAKLATEQASQDWWPDEAPDGDLSAFYPDFVPPYN